jgi:hypothetical protein
VPQQLFHNLRNGTFEEVAVPAGAAYDSDGRSFSGMGTDFADYDNDGWPDIFVNALATQRYALFHNVRGAFDYVSDLSGIGRASMLHSGWGTKFVDLDNDGWKDLFVGQSHVMDNIQLSLPQVRYLEPPLILQNQNGRFVDVSAGAGPALLRAIAARGVAFGDLDNDGRIDVVINRNNEPPLILRNRSVPRHWLLIHTTGRASNRDGIGAQARITLDTGQQYATASPAGSYLSSNDKRIHFGLGEIRTIKQFEITWPSGTVQRLNNVAADQILRITEP